MKLLKFIACVLISFSAAAIGNLATIPNIASWYASLEKPLLNPPNEIFGPVWTLLYLLLAISLYLIWTANNTRSKRSAYLAFGAQLLLNTLWSLVFFGLHAPWAALVVILALLVSIVFTIMLFYRISRSAAYLLIPYISWVLFATYLNGAIAIIN